MNAQTNATLSALADLIEQATMLVVDPQEPTELVHVDPTTDADASLDGYLADLAGRLELERGMDIDAALEFILDCAEECAEEGHLPPLPEDEDSMESAMWLGKAATYGFGAKVLDAAASAE